jgi:M3 family oligoendopeptidase
MNEDLPFSELPYTRPDQEALRAGMAQREAAWAAAETASEQLAVLSDWELQRKAFFTRRSLAEVRFHQDTVSKDIRAEKEFFDQIDPEVQGAKVRFLTSVTRSPHRPALEAALGSHVFRLWDAELTTFRDEIADDKRAESALINRYNSMLAAVRIPFQGEEHTFSTLRGFLGNADRSVRLAATQAQSGALGAKTEQLDDIFSQLTTVRDRMAKSLGYDHYTPLGYRELQRTDYGPAEVADFRAAIEQTIVPLARRIRQRQARVLGVSDYSYHDEAIRDLKGAPRPNGDHDWMLDRAEEMFSTMGTDFGEFFSMMRRRELLDLKSRSAKTGGGFCTSFEEHKIPFIFANFNGSQDDVNVFTHECGHAFQSYSSRTLKPREYLWPTYEACEIHSMGLEFLTYPHMGLFFGDDAERFRTGHLESAITFIPYGAAVDAFQHGVYDSPGDDGATRAASWKALEARYLPWRRYEASPCFSGGRAWQRQRHIYNRPFYYIDYCLAQVCALQLWSRARTDRPGTMALYRELCKLGGSMPFTGLLDAVGLENPFDPDVIARVAAEVAETLDLS